tara:strand:- start:1010 stop:2026 length:1017 start_codon:yes stop_codon:yes gene_type:complete
MAITDAKKVDYLWKKIGYGATKTDTNAAKKAPNEAIASPLLLRGDKVWNQASLIPATKPGSSAGVVTCYNTSAPDETTADGTAAANRTWKTGLADWIPPEFGSTYQVKVYIHTSGDAGNAASSGDQVFATGSGNNDEWFFDYQSGVVHFIGANLPNGINFSGKSVYVSGARYTGTLGLQNFSTASTGDITFTGSTISAPSNADMTFDNSGTGSYIFEGTTSMTLPKGNTAQRPTAETGVIRFNTQTGQYEVSQDGSTYTNLRTDADAADVTKDIFAGDGSTQSFTMSITPTDENTIVVYIDGVMQEPDQNYTISGTTIDFGEAAHAGARISVLHGFAD